MDVYSWHPDLHTRLVQLTQVRRNKRHKAEVIDEEALCGEGSLAQTTNGENAGTMRKHKRNGAEEKNLTVMSKGLDLIWDGVWSHGGSQRGNICPHIIYTAFTRWDYIVPTSELRRLKPREVQQAA